MTLKFKRLHPDAVLPTYAHPGDAGMDLSAVEDVVLLPGVPTKVRLGFAVEVPPGYELQIRPRSGLALKHGVSCHLGTCDSSFRGEVCAILRWDGHEPNGTAVLTKDRNFKAFSTEPPLLVTRHISDFAIPAYKVRKGDRIAQGVIAAYASAAPEWAEELGATERGAGGFGSSGV